VNYELNSWGGEAGGPRECPSKGFRSFAAEESGHKVALRSESFSDHYSQARQFYMSQTPIEQDHIAAAFTFELSKVETPAIRARMVSHLIHVNNGLADKVAYGLRLNQMRPLTLAKPVRTDLAKSRSPSIVPNGPESFAGRNVGVLATDGSDPALSRPSFTRVDAKSGDKSVSEKSRMGARCPDQLEARAFLRRVGCPRVSRVLF
jgi:catalase